MTPCIESNLHTCHPGAIPVWLPVSHFPRQYYLGPLTQIRYVCVVHPTALFSYYQVHRHTSLQRILVRVAFPSPWLGRCWSVPILRKFNPGIHRVPSFIPRSCGADAFHVHPISVWRSSGREKISVFFSILVMGTNCNELGKGRPRLETGATDDGLLGFLKE